MLATRRSGNNVNVIRSGATDRKEDAAAFPLGPRFHAHAADTRDAPTEPAPAGALRARIPTKTIVASVALCAMIGTWRVTAAGPGDGRADRLARCEQVVYRRALDRARPFIVRIDTIGGAQPTHTQVDRAGHARRVPGFRQADGPTTGIVVSADGFVLTSNFNFVRDPTVITVTLADGKRYVARLVARDEPAHLALLKVAAHDLPVARWSPRTRRMEPDAPRLRVGQRVIAAGYGFGTPLPAPAVGILSALWRMDGRALQTDARISPAHYGGPLLDIEGRVVGVCVPMGPGEDALAGVEWYDSGIAFAIPRDYLAGRLERMMKGETLRRGYLGLNLDTRARVVVGEFPASAHRAPGVASRPAQPLPPDGLRVVGKPVGPAARVGLRAGDVITHIDGTPTRTVTAFRRVLARRAAGDRIAVCVRRGEQTREVALTLASAEELQTPPSSRPRTP